ncbi:MAG: ABC transporter substrate-binding protein, partial [Spirochaetales bacterium]|nr:ABC transporter substrate-binding protein [Spirochaetales bacterium]
TSDHHFWRMGFQEMPLVGDFEKYGPRGSGEFEFLVRGFIPLTYMKGQLLESFDIQKDKIIWNVRKGVYWHGNKPDVMKSRELVASDLVWWVNYRRQAPAGSYIKTVIGDAKEIDKYTLEIPFLKGYDFTVMYLIGYEDRACVEPPESVKAGADQWDKQVGTGPFMNEEYVVGAYFKYSRNPNYWDTTTIDGKEYELPFVDEWTHPIIAEEASRVAALRTGKVDWFATVPAPHWPTLDKNPDIMSKKAVAAIGEVVAPQLNKPPFNDINVRRALMIGTDIAAFNRLLGVDIDMPIDFHPAYPGDPSVYTPINELPADLQELYKYDPVKAKKMLADAGYPNGFKMEVVFENPPMDQERASLLASQWAKIGVEVEIKICDNTTYVGYRYDKNFKDALQTVVETPGAVFLLQRTAYTGATLNPGHYSSAKMDALIDDIVGTVDNDEMNRKTKAACVELLRDVHVIPLQVGLDGYYWWPWVKNYAGEFNVADAMQPVPIIARMWVDQDLKKKMGY